MAGIGTALGLGVVLSMVNRLSGPASAASASMQTLSMATDRATRAQLRMEVAARAGRVALIGAAGASVALALVTAEAARFEEGMKRVEAILVPTTGELKALTAAAVEAGIKTRWSPTQATEGLKELATAGFTAGEATAALMPVLDLATGSLGQLGVAGAASAAAAGVRGFGFEAKDTAKVVDILLRSTQLTNIQARDLQVMLARVGGNAKAMGQEFEHTVAILGALRNTGAEASVSATTLRSAIRALMQPKATAELQKLGLSATDANGNFKDMATLMFEIQNALGKTTEEQRALSLMTLFGARGMNAFNAVVAMGPENFAKLENELKNASGTAAKFREAVLEPLIGRLVLMMGSIQTLAMRLGSPLLGPLKMAVSFFTKILNVLITLTMWFPRTTKVIMLLVGAVVFLTGLVGTVLVLGSAFMKLNLALGLVTKAKFAYLAISKLIFGIEGMTRGAVLASIFAEKLRLTQTDLTNAKMKIRIWLERILGIGISKNTSITYAAVSAAWAKRVATIGNNVALGINNTLTRINSMLKWGNIRASFGQAKAAIMGSTAMKGAAAASGIFTGAIRGMTAAMLANPILLIITAIIVFTILLVKVARAFWNAKGSAQAFYGILLVLMSPIGWLIIAAKIFASAWQQNLGGVRDAWKSMRKAISMIFEPLGRLFNAMKGVGPMGKLFKSVMTVVMMPFARAFELIGVAATVVGAIVEIVVQEIEAAFAPLTPVVEELGTAFDELGVAVFGRGGANVGFWKAFGTVVRWVVRNTLEPLAKVISWIIKGITWMTRGVKALVDPLVRVRDAIVDILDKGIGTVSGIIGTVAGAIGLQHGGIVTRPTVAALAETGRPEVVMPLPSGLGPGDLKDVFDAIKRGEPTGAAPAAGGGPVRVVIENRIFLDGREIRRYQRELDDLDMARAFV